MRVPRRKVKDQRFQKVDEEVIAELLVCSGLRLKVTCTSRCSMCMRVNACSK